MKKTMEFLFNRSLITLVILIAGLLVFSSCGGPNTIVGKTFVQQAPYPESTRSIVTFSKTGTASGVDIDASGRRKLANYDYVVVDNDLKLSGMGGLMSQNLTIKWINSNKMQVTRPDGLVEIYAVQESSDDDVTSKKPSVAGKTFIQQGQGTEGDMHAVYAFGLGDEAIIKNVLPSGEEKIGHFYYLEKDSRLRMDSKGYSKTFEFNVVWVNKNRITLSVASGGSLELAMQGTSEDNRHYGQ
jgi:hypothetical protein